MYRDFDLLMDGKPIGEAVSVWVLANLDTHKLFRLGNVREFDDTSGGALCKEKLLPRLKVPVPLVPTQARALHYSDTDVNGHVNNVRYADFACDALEMQRLGQGQFVSSVQIGYLKECRAGRPFVSRRAAKTEHGMCRATGKRESRDLTRRSPCPLLTSPETGRKIGQILLTAQEY